MGKLRVAILEDNKQLLKDLKQNLEETKLVEVVAWATSSNEFIEKVNSSKPDALLLDIDLGGDSMNGLDIAYTLKLPVLFVSGKTSKFYQGIEDLNINTENSVEHISKPITLEKLNKMLPKFIYEINLKSKAEFVYLNFLDSKRNKILVDTIVYFCADKHHGSDSNNKQVFFSNRKPEKLVNFSFSNMNSLGFDSKQFIQTHKSYRVNVSKIQSYTTDHNVIVEIIDEDGNPVKKQLPVSDTYHKIVKDSLKK